VAQVLHVLNSPEIQDKLSHEGGRVARLVHRISDNGLLVDEFFLTFLNRYPSDEERTRATNFLRDHADNRRQAAEDLAWTLLNTVEFLFNH
jgi:hypothetical protein